MLIRIWLECICGRMGNNRRQIFSICSSHPPVKLCALFISSGGNFLRLETNLSKETASLAYDSNNLLNVISCHLSFQSSSSILIPFFLYTKYSAFSRYFYSPPALVFTHTPNVLSSSYFLSLLSLLPLVSTSGSFPGVCSVFKTSRWQVITVTA